VPLAVQQWEGLIAVNYAARARGVTRHARVDAALALCPELRLVHVETIGDDGAGPEGAEAKGAGGEAGADAEAPGAAAAAAHADAAAHRALRLTRKACLERYRRANREIMDALHGLAPGAVIEKASIDEVYIDATALVDAELAAREQGDDGADGADGGAAGGADDGADADGGAAAAAAFAWGSVVPGGPLDPRRPGDRRLAAGAALAARLRGALLGELGFSCSAGVASNKLLAKVGSALNKPNLQTVITARGAAGVMAALPLAKLSGFGGKLGAALAEMGASTAGAVAALPPAALAARLGPERAAAVAAAVRGYSPDAVEERKRPRSMLAAKSFEATSDLAALERWARVLVAELAERVAVDEAAHRRRPRTLVVHFRRYGGAADNGVGGERSRQAPMPCERDGGRPSAATLAGAAWALFRARCADEALPCHRLAISAADFVHLPVPAANAITRFFAKRDEGGADAAAAADAAAPPAAEARAKPAREAPRGEEPAARGAKRQATLAGPPPDPAVLADPLLAGIDVEEQRRLLQDARMAAAAARRRAAAPPAAASAGKGKQAGIARFFGGKG
jgi:DNA polymerase eta